MPLQNRVDPEGAIHAVPARGTFMGNRGGRLHDDSQRLQKRRWACRQWITCLLDFKGRQRRVMGASYTELFFLDEVTALAAGHRPCFECRRSAARSFAGAFPGADRAPEMDRILHVQRLMGERIVAMPGDVPEGAMFLIGGQPHAKRGDRGLPWSFEGYGAPVTLPRTACMILTPPASCAALSAGYVPVWHPAAPVPG